VKFTENKQAIYTFSAIAWIYYRAIQYMGCCAAKKNLKIK